MLVSDIIHGQALLSVPAPPRDAQQLRAIRIPRQEAKGRAHIRCFCLIILFLGEGRAHMCVCMQRCIFMYVLLDVPRRLQMSCRTLYPIARTTPCSLLSCLPRSPWLWASRNPRFSRRNHCKSERGIGTDIDGGAHFIGH